MVTMGQDITLEMCAAFVKCDLLCEGELFEYDAGPGPTMGFCGCGVSWNADCEQVRNHATSSIYSLTDEFPKDGVEPLGDCTGVKPSDLGARKWNVHTQVGPIETGKEEWFEAHKD